MKRLRIRKRTIRLFPLRLAAFATLLPLLAFGAPARAFSAAPQGTQSVPSFADPAFQQVWARTDAPVASGAIQRSWYWGPQPGEARNEPYSGNSSGTRLVQYFDKGRMELNNPAGDRSSEWFVTTGLLVAELVSGKQQIGDKQYRAIGPAEIAVGGDGLSADPDAPTYTSFRPIASLTGPGANRAPNRTDQLATSTINRAGIVGDDPALGFYPGARMAAYSDVLGHNIPQAMWDFLNLKGLVEQNGALKDGQPVANWIFVMGYPITEPYWARIKISGVYYDVLFQMYERRSLAYIPSFSKDWQVQMGNVGAHYYRWLYGGPLPTPLALLTPTAPAPIPTLTALIPTTTPPVPQPTVTSATQPPTSTPPIPSSTPTFVPISTSTPTPQSTQSTATGTPTYPPVPTEPPDGLVLAVRPGYGPPSGRFTFEASGLAPNEPVQVKFTDPNHNTVYPAGSNGGHYQADLTGRLTFTLIPTQAFPSAPIGIWLFELDGLQSGLEGVTGFTLR